VSNLRHPLSPRAKGQGMRAPRTAPSASAAAPPTSGSRCWRLAA